MILPSQRRSVPAKNCVVRYAEADIPTAHGPMRFVVFRPARGEEVEHVAVILGEPLAHPDNVLVRVHSECLTSEVFGSLKCDCKQQLEEALARMRANERGGILLYLRQEGRGIGLGNKIRAYARQAEGEDTIEANHKLGFATDLRTYDVAAAMLMNLGVEGVSLLTNNPQKIAGLENAGIRVHERISVNVPANPHSARYLATKRDRLGHLIDQLIAPIED